MNGIDSLTLPVTGIERCSGFGAGKVMVAKRSLTLRSSIGEGSGACSVRDEEDDCKDACRLQEAAQRQDACRLQGAEQREGARRLQEAEHEVKVFAGRKTMKMLVRKLAEYDLNLAGYKLQSAK